MSNPLGSTLRHGHAKRGGTSREYHSWCAMRQRCENENTEKYPRYGGRGIKVCERWQVFENFLEDMGPCPPGMTIDRKDNDGNYEPGNCRWADDVEQANKRSNNRLLTFDGRTQTIAQWARERGWRRSILQDRIRRGWSLERALTEPPREPGPPRAKPVRVPRVAKPKTRPERRTLLCARCGREFVCARKDARHCSRRCGKADAQATYYGRHAERINAARRRPREEANANV